MATTITVTDTRHERTQTFTVSFPENMPLSIDMFESGEGFSYSVGTSDTADVVARVKFVSMLNELRRYMGTRTHVNEVHFANDQTFVKLKDVRVITTDKENESYLEVESETVIPKEWRWFYEYDEVV